MTKIERAKEKLKEANSKVDPVVDNWLTRLKDSPYTAALILAVIVVGGLLLVFLR